MTARTAGAVPTHTPTPWHAGGSGQRVIFGKDGWAVANAVTYHGKGDDLSNAAFIVKACNSHDALVKALEGLLDAVADTMRSHEKELDCCSVTRVRMIEARALLATGAL